MKIGQVPPGLGVTLINWATGKQRRWTKAPIVSDLFSYRNIYEPAVSTVNMGMATNRGLPSKRGARPIFLDSAPLDIIAVTEYPGTKIPQEGEIYESAGDLSRCVFDSNGRDCRLDLRGRECQSSRV